MTDFLLLPLQDKMHELTWVDRIVGLVSPFERKLETGATQRIPLSCEVCMDDCCNSPYKLFTPGSDNTSLLFFQPDSPINYTYDGTSIKLSASVNMVLWINMAAYGQADYCAAKTQFTLNMLNMFPYKHRSEGQIINYTVNSIDTDVSNPFEDYDFDSLGLSIYPYATIVLNIDVTASIGRSCIDPITIGAPIDCP